MNYEFEIIKINQKLKMDDYFFKNQNNNLENYKYNQYLRNIYVQEVKKLIEGSNIYVSQYYLIVTYNGNIKDIERILYKLTKTGCVIKRVKDDIKLKKILYKMLNKV